MLSSIHLLGHMHIWALLRLRLSRLRLSLLGLSLLGLSLLVGAWRRCRLRRLLACWCRCTSLRPCLCRSLVVSLLRLLLTLLSLLALLALLLRALLALLTLLALLALLALLLRALLALLTLSLAVALGLRPLLLASHLTLRVGRHRVLALHVLHCLGVHLHMLTLGSSLHLRIVALLLL